MRGHLTRNWTRLPFYMLCRIATRSLPNTRPYTGKGKNGTLTPRARAANWPEATDEQLSVSKAELTRVLEARLPDLVARFRAVMESDCGFIWQEAPALETAGESI